MPRRVLRRQSEAGEEAADLRVGANAKLGGEPDA